jgi:hypothetical protein
MKINGIETTSIIKVNGLAFSTMKKMAGVTLPTSSPLPSSLSILNADASTWSAGTPTSWTDFNGHVGTLVNGTTYNSSNGGNMVFDGTDDYVMFPDEPALNSQTITMESWFWLEGTTAQEAFLFEKGNVNTQYSSFFYYLDAFYFRTQGLSNVDLSFTTSSYITSNAWYHIACTYGAGTKTIYVNGVQVAQVTGVTGTIPSNTTGLFLGAYYNYGWIDYTLNGKIAISRAYDIELTQTQVLENFNAEKTRFGY